VVHRWYMRGDQNLGLTRRLVTRERPEPSEALAKRLGLPSNTRGGYLRDDRKGRGVSIRERPEASKALSKGLRLPSNTGGVYLRDNGAPSPKRDQRPAKHCRRASASLEYRGGT